ncbi:MAG: penicillin-binding protein 2 [Clostridiales bacterium]|nr:penicillin-binding protein 2 [Clostridiales bacterium]
MKQQRVRFRLMAFFLIALLVVAGAYGVYSVSTYGSRWFGSSYNTRYRAARKTVIPGDIIDRNGVVLATTDAEGKRTYASDPYTRTAMVHLVGDGEGNVANSVDAFQASYLWGFETSLKERVIALFSGESRRGDNVTLTVDSKLQTTIAAVFDREENSKGKAGAAVVMNYQTGEVLALLSLPAFDPMSDLKAVSSNAQHPFWNRALQSVLPPGSTFKIVTAVAALNHLPQAETRTFDCSTGATMIMEQIIRDYGYEHHGMITLDKAFRVSCNNSFAQAALLMGDEALRKTAEGFGFNDNFLFRDLVVENSVYPTKNRNDFEIAWSGAGQSQVAATPLHMCMVAASIANDGVMMEPRILKEVVSPKGVQRMTYSQKVYRQACDSATAAKLETYMKDVVLNGTGKSAAVEGVSIAGKTGSAESSLDGKYVTHAWFVGYIDDPAYPYAVSVFVEEGNSGGKAAAPIAREIFAYLIQQSGR